MNVKLFEIRDRCTFIPVMAIRFDPTCEAERFLLARSGHGLTPTTQNQYIMLANLVKDEAMTNPFKWSNQRTMGTAHQFIVNNWDSLVTGEVLDVEFILGETNKKKVSEAFRLE